MTSPGAADTVTVLLGGDVMLGRGIDQILAHPADPGLREGYVRDARRYVDLAEQVSGPIPRPVEGSWPWGDALAQVEAARPAVLVINVETAITRCDDFAMGKGINYRMSPENIGALQVVRPDVCVLANNHVLDFGRRGLEETLDTVSAAGLRTAGAGRDLTEAGAPAVVEQGGVQLAVLAYGHSSSGVPDHWAAGRGRPGIALLPDLSQRTADAVGDRVRAQKERGRVVVVSLHWGSNWGYRVPHEQVRFAHRIIEAGVDVVHGHSSHHPRPVEVYRDRLVLYGCGDLVNDYEGIEGHEEYRGDLRLLYRVTLRADGSLLDADLLPFRSRRLRLERAEDGDVRWLGSVLDRESRAHRVRVRAAGDGGLRLAWA